MAQIDSKFFGKWLLDPSQTVGGEDFGKALGYSSEMVQKYKDLKYFVNMTQDGDCMVVDVDFQGASPNSTYKVKLGEAIDYHNPVAGYTAKVTLTYDGEKTTEAYNYAEKNLTWTVTRSVDGAVMTSVSKCGSATMTQKFNKQ